MTRYNANDAVSLDCQSRDCNIAPDGLSKNEAAIGNINNIEEYFTIRSQILEREASVGFDWSCQHKASDNEYRANAILQTLRHNDNLRVYERAPARQGYGGQEHRRVCGDHFLSNADLIEETDVFKVAQKMPKGAHLHLHFNANLPPDFLLDIAKKMPRMFITSTDPLISDNDYINYKKCEIQFRIRSEADELPGNLFSSEYERGQTMQFSQFIREFPSHYMKASVDDWLKSKLVFNEEEVHHCLQTVKGAWELFDKRTRMMKGLFNYETAFREYTKQCLQEFVRDNIQYAEIRVNFMQTNQIWFDDGCGQITNEGMMDIIVEECERFQEINNEFYGLKIIYCTPRSFSETQIAAALDECREFKKKYPKYIAGYDLVGEEAAGKPLKDFIRQFLDFDKSCRDEGYSIPFLFHGGETLDIGTEVDQNLVDAILLGAKRIGHGFSLPRHPSLIELVKKQRICLEINPISNEELNLIPRMSGHSVYTLLANDVHCTVNSDNPTLFRSTLSHDFYQIMVGSSSMTLHGWRQLVEWSLEHSCMNKDELTASYGRWEDEWNRFLQWIIETYGEVEKLSDAETSP
ncbi:hypothetical protein QBC47DRAFT_302869 [Echria macrotheca]|uniref:adenosine deaminase n=1 Tax=Echria macrotheca TaxID=438768 RepID=A0AAJ0F564_9PEZI|nr:hypothetical protein QBC47DRAFT_302869 [Echria macrotheca]